MIGQRDPVDIDGATYLPAYASPGYLTHGDGPITGPRHRCRTCDVAWSGTEACFVCGVNAA